MTVTHAHMGEQAFGTAEIWLTLRTQKDTPKRALVEQAEALVARSSKVAMFLFGSGSGHTNLHNPDFDFADDLIGTCARVLVRTLESLCFAKT